MLTVTRDTGVAINSLATQWGLPETAGLRIQAQESPGYTGHPALGLSMAELADSGDSVITEDTTGARVFMDEEAAQFLDDKVLDVGRTMEGDAQFTLRPPEVEPVRSPEDEPAPDAGRGSAPHLRAGVGQR